MTTPPNAVHADAVKTVVTALAGFTTFKEAFRFLTILPTDTDDETVTRVLDQLHLLATDNQFDLLPTENVGYFKFQKLKNGRIVVIPSSAGMSKALFAHNVGQFCDWLGKVKPDIPRDIAHKFARAGGMFYAPRTSEMAEHYETLFTQCQYAPNSTYPYSKYRVTNGDVDVGRRTYLVSFKTAQSLASAVGLTT